MNANGAANALAAASDSFSALLDDVDDPSRPAIGVWTIADTAAHVAFVMEHIPAYLAGTEELPGHAREFEHLADAHTAFNDDALRSAPARELSTLSKKAQAGAQRLIETAGSLDPEKRYPWFGGVAIPLSSYLAVAINEFLVHGFDIARAARQRWPVDRATAALVVEGFLPMIPHYIDHAAASGFNARYELRVRGGANAYLIFENGVLSVSNEPPTRFDCHISADPWWYLLVAYGRVGQWRAGLRGKIVTWGRRPWLGLKLGGLSATP
jgi:uncharacterized protein (TIGR03083 family)